MYSADNCALIAMEAERGFMRMNILTPIFNTRQQIGNVLVLNNETVGNSADIRISATKIAPNSNTTTPQGCLITLLERRGKTARFFLRKGQE